MTTNEPVITLDELNLIAREMTERGWDHAAWQDFKSLVEAKAFAAWVKERQAYLESRQD